MPLFKGDTKMELVTKEYFNVVMNTFEQASYLERVAKKVGYPHAVFKGLPTMYHIQMVLGGVITFYMILMNLSN